MKKLVMTLALASLFGTAQMSAQGLMKKMMSNLYGGPKVEANLSTFFLSDMPGVDSKMGVGGSVGGFLGMRLTEHFAVQEDLLVHYKTSDFKQSGATGDFKYMGAEFAIYAMGNWTLHDGSRISIGAGPFVGYGLNAKYKVNGVETDLYDEDENGDMPFNPMNVGAAILLGYELRCGLQINASCKCGIMNMLDAHKDDASMRPGTISLGVAYRFGKK